MSTQRQRHVSKVEFDLSCSGLKSLDTFSKSDPCVIVYERAEDGQSRQEVGRTESKKNDNNPKFDQKVIVEFYFERQQYLDFEVVDGDGSSNELIGAVRSSIAQIVSERGSAFERTIKNAKGEETGKISIRHEELRECRDSVEFHFSGKKLPKMDGLLGKADPFMRIMRQNEDGSFTTVHETEVQKGTLNPDWEKFTLSVVTLCNADRRRKIRVEVWDWDRASDPDQMGEFTFSLSELQKGGRHSHSFELTGVGKKSGKKVGTIELEYEARRTYTFLEYVNGGMELELQVAIDMTGSNGHPRDRDSLHYIGKDFKNQYQQALERVAPVLEQYDTDKKFMAYGYGAELPSGDISHCFSLKTLQEGDDAECSGVASLISHYREAVHKVNFSGPTYLGEVLETVKNKARDGVSRGKQRYTVLLVLCDGALNDYDDVAQTLVEASRLPMSVIIIGVGDGPFGAMDALDSDGALLRSPTTGQTSVRDNVQFVPATRRFGQDSAKLCEEVLRELPGQVEAFMQNQAIAPLSS